MTKFDKDIETSRNYSGSHSNTVTEFLTATSSIGDKVVNRQGRVQAIS